MPQKPKISIRKLIKAKIRGDQRLNVGFQLYGFEIPDWTMVKKKVRENRDGLRISTYIYQLEGPEGTRAEGRDKRIKLEVLEGGSSAEALDNMQRILDQTMAAQLMGPGEDAGIDLGDGSIINSYRAEAGEILDFLFFSRSNLTGKFNSIGNTPISVVEFAEGLDGFFSQGQANTDGVAAVELQFSVENSRMRVGETQELTYGRAVPPPAGHWWWFMANTAHCELVRDENDRVFFTPSRVGKVDILCANFDEVLGRSVTNLSVVVLP